MIEENAPTQYRKQHGQTLLMCDIALAERIIEDDQHKDMMYYIQMRDSFYARSQGRDSMLGRLVDGTQGSGESTEHNLADKYRAFLREFDRTAQPVMMFLATEGRVNTSGRAIKAMQSAGTQIRETIDAFSAWCRK